MSGYRLRYMKGSFVQFEDVDTLTMAMTRMAILRAGGCCYAFMVLGPEDRLVLDEEQVHAFMIWRRSGDGRSAEL